MGPVEGVLVSTGVALALVGVGYLVGRHWPMNRNRGPAQRVVAKDHRPQGLGAGDGTAPARPSRPPHQREMDERLQREMEQVQALRLSRENAEPWLPPAVDAVHAPGSAAWVADSAARSHDKGQTR